MKALLVCSMALLSFAAVGQIEKGGSFLTGNAGMWWKNNGAVTEGSYPFKAASFHAAVTYGYMVANRWAVGIKTGYSFIKARDGFGYDRYHNYQAGPLVRRYFKVKEKFFLHLDVAATFALSKSYSVNNFDVKSDISTVNSRSVYLSPGASYFVGKQLAISMQLPGLAYSRWKSNQGSGDSRNSGIGLSPMSLGLSYYF